MQRHGLRWALEAIVVGHLTVARVAWDTANDAVLADGKWVLIIYVRPRSNHQPNRGTVNGFGVSQLVIDALED